MQTKGNPLKVWLLGAVLLLPTVIQAQFVFATNTGAITITGYTGTNGVVTIPSTIDGLAVTSIGYEAFWACESLISITVGNNVTNIANGAFWECQSLTNVTLPDSVINIDIGAFDNCTSLRSVTIPSSVTSISNWAFGLCSSLTQVYFQGNAPNLGISVFDFDFPTVYYLPGTSGWSNFTANTGLTIVQWLPQIQTDEASISVRSNGFGFHINWASGKTVVVEASAYLSNPIWKPVQTNTLTGGTAYFIDLQRMNYPDRFYRLHAP